MVSTRQMLTNGCSSNGNSNGGGLRTSRPQNQSSVVAADPVECAGLAAKSALLDLPTETIEEILSYFDFAEISQLRMVSVRFNEICKSTLNAAFAKLISQTSSRFQAVKSSMPRRESVRRYHPLNGQYDMIETCNMRLSLLHMTLGKHIERGHICFFPGAVLDEVSFILKLISITPQMQRPYHITDELFDLSTMAMEYFREHLEPSLPRFVYCDTSLFKKPSTSKRLPLSTSSGHSSGRAQSPPQTHMVLRKGIRKIKQGMRMYNNQLSGLRTELRTLRRKLAEQTKQISEQQKAIAAEQKQSLELANRLNENDRKNDESARKMSTLLQEFNKCKAELQFWRSKSPAICSTLCGSCYAMNVDNIQVEQQDDVNAIEEHTDVSESQGNEQYAAKKTDNQNNNSIMLANNLSRPLKRKGSDQSNAMLTTMPSISCDVELKTPMASPSNQSVGPPEHDQTPERCGVIVRLSDRLLEDVPSSCEADSEVSVEPKKSRRVQKTIRFVSTSGKRSK